MSSVCFSVSLGLILTANLLVKNSRGLPIPTTSLPLPPGRFLPQPFEKDGYDYPGKKYPRNWGPPPPELYNPNTFKEQDPRSMIDTSSIQQDFGNNNYYNNYEPEGHYSEEDHYVEEEEVSYEAIYSGENNFESSQMTYAIESNNVYSKPYVNNGYLYMGNDFATPEIEFEYENELDTEPESSLEEDIDFDNDDMNEVITMPANTQPSSLPPNSGWSIQKPLLPLPPPPLQQKPLPPPMQQQLQQMQHQAKLIASASQLTLSSSINDNDSSESDSKSKTRELRSFKSSRNSPPALSKAIKEIKSVIEEPPVDTPREKELFSRTTTITKTTTWYINSDDEITVSEDVDMKPSPLRGKYVKTSKTTTSGPVPWYLQGFEDVIFEEENGKSKTILDKMSYLRNMNPTSITSYTTAPNPWSTEVHEEVVFEEIPDKKDSQRNEPDMKGHFSHSSPLEHIVDYLPRSQLVPEEVVEVIEKVFSDIIEDEITIEEMIEEEEFEVIPPYQVPIQAPKQHLYSSQEEMFVSEISNYRDFNTLNSNQIPTKSLPPSPPPPPPPPPVDTNFNPQPNYPYQSPNSQTTPAPLQQQSFSNHPQQQPNHPQQLNREHPGNRRDHQQQRPNIEQQSQEDVNNRHPRGEVENQRKISQIEVKRQLYQNRQQQHQQQPQYPNRPSQGRPRDL